MADWQVHNNHRSHWEFWLVPGECACDGGIVIGPYWRRSACLRHDQYMSTRRGFTHHNQLLWCKGITALNANIHGMNLDAHYVLIACYIIVTKLFQHWNWLLSLIFGAEKYARCNLVLVSAELKCPNGTEWNHPEIQLILFNNKCFMIFFSMFCQYWSSRIPQYFKGMYFVFEHCLCLSFCLSLRYFWAKIYYPCLNRLYIGKC